MTGGIARVFMVLASCALISSCVGDVGQLNGRGGSGMDMQGAAERADALLDDVLEEIRPEVQWTHGPTTTGSCDVTRRRAVMTIISAERRGSFLGLVDRFWRKSDYRIKAVNDDVDVPAIFAQTRDGFGVSLIVGGKGQAFFEVDSPCVRESGVAEPLAKPNGPSYADAAVIPRPNIHSDFWSAGAS
ncbi:hypothetical protein [Streptomyces brevispora]|uniref:LppA-like lipoprotein n=1 Tax=Streptomyces brevispora TaxID=887462 RepID=A0ABZ1G315_9ACTN|nr:hypothetical protein [Streptomyces brevispora]WSC14275.1 hypothetical protein OIE64_16430 [Streptomyces brevispora]